MTRTLTMLSNAESTPGADDARARPWRLQAWRQYRLATDALRRGDGNRATLWLDRAESDAELAFALARQAVTTAQAAQAVARLEAFRRNTNLPPAAPGPER